MPVLDNMDFTKNVALKGRDMLLFVMGMYVTSKLRVFSTY